MAIIRHIRQSWAEIGNERLYSSLYIVGVALSVSTVMVLSIMLYARLSPVYPELKRGRMMYVTDISVRYDRGFNWWGLSKWDLENWIDSMKTVDYYTAMTDNSTMEVRAGGGLDSYDAEVKGTDAGFFRVYDFVFTEGSPYTSADVGESLPKVVVADNFARKMFGSAEGIAGREIYIDYEPYTISGVVRSASSFMDSYADIYSARHNVSEGPLFLVGGYKAVLIPKEGVTWEQMNGELEVLKRPVEIKNEGLNLEINLFGQPRSHYEHTFVPSLSMPDDDDDSGSSGRYLGYYVIVAAVLLFIPAMNLSGMIIGRMEQRRGEMGIRKSFGAQRSGLLWQVLVENFLLTMIGAAIGLVVSWVLVYVARDVVFSLIDPDMEIGSDTQLSMETYFSPGIFAIALGVTLILNLLSSYIPAWWSLRHPIVKSLNEHR